MSRLSIQIHEQLLPLSSLHGLFWPYFGLFLASSLRHLWHILNRCFSFSLCFTHLQYIYIYIYLSILVCMHEPVWKKKAAAEKKRNTTGYQHTRKNYRTRHLNRRFQVLLSLSSLGIWSTHLLIDTIASFFKRFKAEVPFFSFVLLSTQDAEGMV